MPTSDLFIFANNLKHFGMLKNPSFFNLVPDQSLDFNDMRSCQLSSLHVLETSGIVIQTGCQNLSFDQANCCGNGSIC